METAKIVDRVLEELEDSDLFDFIRRLHDQVMGSGEEEPDFDSHFDEMDDDSGYGTDEEPADVELEEEGFPGHYDSEPDQQPFELPDANVSPWTRNRYSRVAGFRGDPVEQQMKEIEELGDSPLTRAIASQYARQRYAERGYLGGRS
jgi:hypothetical protein